MEVSDFTMNSSFLLYFNWAICSAPSPHFKGKSYDLWSTLDPGRSKALGGRSENICQVGELYLNETKSHRNSTLMRQQVPIALNLFKTPKLIIFQLSSHVQF